MRFLDGWVELKNAQGVSLDVYHREINGHRCAVQRGPIGSMRWWAFVDGNPIGGCHDTPSEAARICEKLANPVLVRNNEE